MLMCALELCIDSLIEPLGQQSLLSRQLCGVVLGKQAFACYYWLIFIIIDDNSIIK